MGPCPPPSTSLSHPPSPVPAQGTGPTGAPQGGCHGTATPYMPSTPTWLWAQVAGQGAKGSTSEGHPVRLPTWVKTLDLLKGLSHQKGPGGPSYSPKPSGSTMHSHTLSTGPARGGAPNHKALPRSPTARPPGHLRVGLSPRTPMLGITHPRRARSGSGRPRHTWPHGCQSPT